jgi:hypothetical protein
MHLLQSTFCVIFMNLELVLRTDQFEVLQKQAHCISQIRSIKIIVPSHIVPNVVLFLTLTSHFLNISRWEWRCDAADAIFSSQFQLFCVAWNDFVNELFTKILPNRQGLFPLSISKYQ